jgi:hypothetical protein
MDAAERCVKSLGVVDILFVLLRKKVEERREFKNYTKEE